MDTELTVQKLLHNTKKIIYIEVTGRVVKNGVILSS